MWEEEERERKKQISAREITKFRQRVGYCGRGRKREKETNISREITKFRQRVGNKQQQELWEEEERERNKYQQGK